MSLKQYIHAFIRFKFTNILLFKCNCAKIKTVRIQNKKGGKEK